MKNKDDLKELYENIIKKTESKHKKEDNMKSKKTNKEKSRMTAGQ